MRLQLALNVENLDRAIEFYTKLFDTPPAKVKPGYANWSIDNPPLKLVIFENSESHGSINHLGVEADTAEEVVAARARLAAAGLQPSEIDEAQCCFAEKTETWVNGADGHLWEWYVKNADVEQFVNISLTRPKGEGDVCCSS